MIALGHDVRWGRGACAGFTLALALALLSSTRADAQTATHREVPRGEVSGLELGIDGSLVVAPGRPLLWWTTLYEIVRGRDLRRAAGCSLRASFEGAPSAPIATVTTDAAGRARLVMPMPARLDALGLEVEATCPSRVQRRFHATLEREPEERIDIALERPRTTVGDSVTVLGRVTSPATGSGVDGVEVLVEVSRRGARRGEDAVVGTRRVTTDRAGLFVARLDPFTAPGAIAVTARTVHEDRAPSNRAVVEGHVDAAPASAPFLVRVVPSARVAAPGDVLDLGVEVRDLDGVPIEGASVVMVDRSRRSSSDDAVEGVRTDARGLVRLPWHIPMVAGGSGFGDTSVALDVTEESLGHVVASTAVRVARRRAFAALSVEGGALTPGAPARLFARVVGADGSPRVGEVVELSSAILSFAGQATARATSDASGVAVFEGIVAAQPPADPACGGATATAMTLVVAGAPTSACVPVDPEALVVVRAPAGRLAPGAPLVIELVRSPRAEGRAVVVTALRRMRRRWEPFAEAWVEPSEARATLLPSDRFEGDVWVRARVVEPDGRLARGGGTLARYAPPLSLAVRADGAGASVSGVGEGDAVLVLARGDEALDPAPWLGALSLGRVLDPGETLGLDARALDAALALRVPFDLAASVEQRDGALVPQAMPEDPPSLGLLRDPWRTRERFVRGRLGQIFLAIESFVEQGLEHGLSEIASFGPRGWTWNREMLGAALQAGNIGEEGGAELDGRRIELSTLEALDPTFSFDAVARRITRRRLFRVIRMLRSFTEEAGLDLAWARRGDPRTWLASLVGRDSDEDGEMIESADLLDGWGRPFVLRPTRRHAFLPVMEGWEVASLGPDGRDGTADDLFDPFARVLPSGSVYAQAVGEDELVARLGAVSLGRAWIAALLEDGLFESSEVIDASSLDRGSAGALLMLERALPRPVPLAPSLASARGFEGDLGGEVGASRVITWRVHPTRSDYVSVALAVPLEGEASVASARFTVAPELRVRAALPTLLRVGDRASIPIVAVDLAGERAPVIELSSSGRASSARLIPRPSAEPGVARATVELEGLEPGQIELVVGARRDREGDAPARAVHARVRVLPGGSLVVARTSAVLSGGERLALDPSPDPRARSLDARAFVLAPRALDRLPLIEALASGDGPTLDPRLAVLAWARALNGRLDPALADRLRGAVMPTRLAEACRALAVEEGLDPLRRSVASLFRDDDDFQTRLATVVAFLGATSPAIGTPSVADPRSFSDRDWIWQGVDPARTPPSVMARAAATLLLADRASGPGRLLYRHVVARLEHDDAGAPIVPGAPGLSTDAWVGALALLVAARQVEDDALAAALARATSRELARVSLLDDEGLLWLLVASTFGGFGDEGDQREAQVVVDGARETVSLDALGAFVLPRGAAIESASDVPLLVALESRELRALEAADESPLEVRVEGLLEAGTGRAALELVVRATRASDSSTLEIELPSLAVYDEALDAALRAVPKVGAIAPPDRGGILRVQLQALAAEEELRLPMTWAWLGSGRVRGLSLVAYEASAPTARTVRPAQQLEVRGGEVP